MKPNVTPERENMLRLAVSIGLQAAECTWPCVGPIELDVWPVGHVDGPACRDSLSLALHAGFLKQTISHRPCLLFMFLRHHHRTYDSSATMICRPIGMPEQLVHTLHVT